MSLSETHEEIEREHKEHLERAEELAEACERKASYYGLHDGNETHRKLRDEYAMKAMAVRYLIRNCSPPSARQHEEER